MSERKLVTFWCPENILKQFDETWRSNWRKYKNRTQAFLAVMRDFIKENQVET